MTSSLDPLWDIVVLGGGPAGQKAAIQGAKAKKRVLLVDQERSVGGACVHQGTIPSKTLRETALSFINFRKRSGHIVDLQIPAETQLASLFQRMRHVISSHEDVIGRQLARNNVKYVHGRARFVSPHEVEISCVRGDKSVVRAEHIVLATGSRPRAPKDVPVDHEHVYDSDSVLSMQYLPRSLIVLGSGVIASEYASIFSALGVHVTMVDKYERPLGFMDREIVGRFVESFGAMGGLFLGGAKISRVHFDGIAQVAVTLSDDKTLVADKVLCAAGRVANVETLRLEACGVDVNAQGLVSVDGSCRTNVPHIFAVGDVVGPPSLASSAMEQGRRAVCEALKLELGPMAARIPTGVYTIPEMASFGLTEDDAAAKEGAVLVGRANFAELTRGHIAACPEGLLKLVAKADGSAILGVHVVGEGASELVHVGQMAIVGNMPLEVFIDTIFNFPTMAEAYRVAALDALRGRA